MFGIDVIFFMYGAIFLVFVAFMMFVFGFVPDVVEEDEIYGYRLTKRKRLVEENDIYAMALPLIQIFAHYFRRMPDKGRLFTLRADLRDKLMRSGFMGAFTPNEFLGLCCVSAVFMFTAL